ncbi:MAG: OmpA family protein [Epsilonproteobacteria bacterium]|nr:OmpA family protein [Campylobacterota bacterium]
MRRNGIKSIVLISSAMLILGGCTATQQGSQEPNSGLSKTQIGAIAGAVLGATVGGVTDTERTSRSRRVLIGAGAGAAIGAAIGYSLDKQAQEVAQVLNTNVDNSPEAEKNPNKELVVSNTEKFVKIMFRSPMMFVTNSITPTPSARAEIQRMIPVFRKYPNMIIQTVGHTDNRGSYEHNQRLSEGRAISVANILKNNGIKNPIYSKGCSYLKPVVPNSNSTNWALNRRVEVYLYPNKESVIDPCSN